MAQVINDDKKSLPHLGFQLILLQWIEYLFEKESIENRELIFS